MKKIQTSVAAAVVTAALSVPFAGAALADSTPALGQSDTLMLAANEAKNAGDAVSDTWITTKVKSVLLAEGSTPGMDIEVETKDGIVSLTGTVATEAEKEMAISKAKDVEGVRNVSADGLKTAD
ncbi:BON domain-containing protein [Stutzerimonas azotifigens]|uniref:BON domain-containing protein n=1 Tax=Stutzerimonas azotifigens TaxID=291995 RepID=A0ABR5Z4Y8_9GAMM|nr:BON domain-containing protein [Stutzerimonas azotifigens]MBA1275271.1 BON domain-containing protein [Stutzerimonas azotifigens]